MRASKYNLLFKHEESNVGFNSLTQQFIILDPLLLELYNAGVQNNNFEDLQKIHPDFYNFLIAQGFLVKDDVDEFQIVKTLSNTIDNDPSSFHLIVNPTMNCNFKCWYCYETHIKDSKMSPETIKAIEIFAEKVIETQNGLKTFHLSFFGGEPLLYFDKVIKPLLISISKRCSAKNIFFSSSMTTNGLLINQKMLDVCKQYGLDGFQITLDGNREQHDKVRFISDGRGSYDQIVANIKLIVKNKLKAHVRINCSSETIPGLNEISAEFDDLLEEDRQFINFDIHKIWQVADPIDGDLAHSRDHFRENGYAMSSASFDTVRGSCYADKRYQATINYNGEVFKCTARDFKDNTGVGLVTQEGNIEWNERFEKRLNIKFNNPPCKECKILPICGGGCSQLALENEGSDYCVHDFDENSKLQVVRDRFERIIG